jgi:NTE family protein
MKFQVGRFTCELSRSYTGGVVGHVVPKDRTAEILSPVRATLQRHVDFDVLNSGQTRLSVGTVNVSSGNFLYFDTTTHKIGPDHILASGALPPGFPAVEIDGQYYWDGGILSNTPLDRVLECPDRCDTLTFQVDLWDAKGDLPRNLIEADLRQKEIRYSS